MLDVLDKFCWIYWKLERCRSLVWIACGLAHPSITGQHKSCCASGCWSRSCMHCASVPPFQAFHNVLGPITCSLLKITCSCHYVYSCCCICPSRWNGCMNMVFTTAIRGPDQSIEYYYCPSGIHEGQPLLLLLLLQCPTIDQAECGIMPM